MFATCTLYIVLYSWELSGSLIFLKITSLLEKDFVITQWHVKLSKLFIYESASHVVVGFIRFVWNTIYFFRCCLTISTLILLILMFTVQTQVHIYVIYTYIHIYMLSISMYKKSCLRHIDMNLHEHFSIYIHSYVYVSNLALSYLIFFLCIYFVYFFTQKFFSPWKSVFNLSLSNDSLIAKFDLSHFSLFRNLSHYVSY